MIVRQEDGNWMALKDGEGSLITGNGWDDVARCSDEWQATGRWQNYAEEHAFSAQYGQRP